jgi:heme A synthase
MFSLWCFIIIKLAKDISIDNNFMRLTLLFIISISHHAILGLITIYSGNFIPLGIFLRIVLVESFYTVFVLLLVFKLIRPIYYLPQY